MLFNAPEFLLGFLPVALVGFFVIGARLQPKWAILWLVLSSLFFYAWWRPIFVLLILGSATFNYLVGLQLSRKPSGSLLTFGIAGNLLALGWFKYSGFLAHLVDSATDIGLPIPHVILPLGLSFYTFQQVAYLVDVNSGDGHETGAARYLLFVTFFPQLIAGPIVHHREMLSQFHRPETYRPRLHNLLLGLAAFSIGLFKKVFIADPLGPQALLAYGPAAHGVVPMSGDAWFGTLAYSLQLYFDFSGYSDMAVGLGLMFGIMLPINFASSFKSANIIEFWSRWHMTLTRFLTSYIYNPIVVSITRRRTAAGKPLFRPKKPAATPFMVQLAIPTVITFGIAGIWHGAGWQFVVFGLYHGIALATCHAWHAVRRAFGMRMTFGRSGYVVAVIVTFLVVNVSFVFFRADSLPHAWLILQAMAGFGGNFQGVAGVGGPDFASMGLLERLLWNFSTFPGLLMIGGFFIVWTLPNTAQFIERLATEIEEGAEAAKNVIRWPLLRWDRKTLMPLPSRFLQGSFVGVLLALALLRAMSVAPTEFLYFTF